MQQIKSVNVVQTAKVLALVYTAIAIVGGFISFVVLTALGHPLKGIMMLFLVPIVYGISGFLLFLILAWVYNQVAAQFGGIEIEIAAVPPS